MRDVSKMKNRLYAQIIAIILISLLLILSCHTLWDGGHQHCPLYQLFLFGFIVVSFFQLLLVLTLIVVLPQTGPGFVKNHPGSKLGCRAPPQNLLSY
jgi:hypothetical protein